MTRCKKLYCINPDSWCELCENKNRCKKLHGDENYELQIEKEWLGSRM